MERNASHILESLKKLSAPFWGKPRIASIIWTFGRQIQELEDTFQEIIRVRKLNEATGVHLETIGRIVGQPRLNNWTDEVYRLYVRGRIVVNRSEGQRRDFLRLLRLFGVRAKIESDFPAGNWVQLLDNPDHSEHIASLLIDSAAAGVGMTVISGADADHAFSFGYWTGTENQGGTPFGDADNPSPDDGLWTYAIDG